MKDVADVVKLVVGRRRVIGKIEMISILLALDLDPEASTIVAGGMSGTLSVGGEMMPAGASRKDVQEVVARHWATMLMCDRHVSINVLATGYFVGDDLATRTGVRWDQSGSMHPMQQADLSFVHVDQRRGEHDPIAFLRRHASRVLLVRDDPPILVAPQPATLPEWVIRLRRLPGIDGERVRVLDNGILQMIDTNDNSKSRHQYDVNDEGQFLGRMLPPEALGDSWQDIGVPEFEPRETPPRDPIMYAYWEARAC